MDPEMDSEMSSEMLEEASPTESMPSSTDQWDRGTMYENSPKKSKFVKYVLVFPNNPPPLTSERERERDKRDPELNPQALRRRPLPRSTTFLILGRTLTASSLPRFMHLWANTFFPYPSLIPYTLISLSKHVETLDTMIASIISLLSTHPFRTGAEGWAHFVHQILHNRLTSGPALIQDFQDLIKGCEKKIYSIEGISQGTYVEMQRESLQSMGCRMGKRVLRMLAGRERTRRLEADLINWIVDTEKWVESGMKELKKEEKMVAREGWIYEGDEWFWQDDLYRPME